MFAAIFAWRAGETRIASGYLDPVAKIQAQDEAVYSHAALRMAKQGDWATPHFMDRFFLYKPPLSYWLAAASVKSLGASALALRLPSILASAVVCVLVFRYAGWLAAALTASNLLFFTMARRNMTDGPLCLATVGMWALMHGDPKLERRRSQALAALAIAAAILVKSTAGAIPVAILCAAWVAQRFPLSRLAGVLAASLALSAPWFLYQYAVHPRWFWGEFVQVELLAFGAGAPPQTTSESAAAFYAHRLWEMDPWLCAMAVVAVPGLIRAWRDSAVLLAWIVVMVAAISGYQYRNATYLLPLIPALAIVAGTHGPLPRPIGWALGTALLAARLYGGYYTPQDTLVGVELSERRCSMGRSNDLILAGAEEQFYSTVLSMPRVRYAFPGDGQVPKGFSLDFREMGVVLTVDEFLAPAAARAKYGPRLAAWGLPDDNALGAVIAMPNAGDLAKLVESSPAADFIISAASKSGLRGVPHSVESDASGNLLLLAPNQSGGKPGGPCRM